MPDYASFRQRLDQVLRTQDVNLVRDFLIAEKQWEVGTPADPELAMWLMIAGSPTLSDLHRQASLWLFQHGHESEAQAVLGQKVCRNSPMLPVIEKRVALAARLHKSVKR